MMSTPTRRQHSSCRPLRDGDVVFSFPGIFGHRLFHISRDDRRDASFRLAQQIPRRHSTVNPAHVGWLKHALPRLTARRAGLVSRLCHQPHPTAQPLRRCFPSPPRPQAFLPRLDSGHFLSAPASASRAANTLCFQAFHRAPFTGTGVARCAVSPDQMFDFMPPN